MTKPLSSELIFWRRETKTQVSAHCQGLVRARREKAEDGGEQRRGGRTDGGLLPDKGSRGKACTGSTDKPGGARGGGRAGGKGFWGSSRERGGSAIKASPVGSRRARKMQRRLDWMGGRVLGDETEAPGTR